MAVWWNGLTTLQQILFVIASSTTLLMVIQIIMLLIGLGGDATFDADGLDAGDGDIFNDEGAGFTVFGLRILSVRSVLAFFCIGSWVAYTLLFPFENAVWAAVILGILAGAGAAFAVAYMIKSLEKLQSSGNVETKNAVGKTGEVYLTVPALREGPGKVNVLVQERLVEYDAVTDADTALKTGSIVKITGMVNDGMLIVEPQKGA
ncbi:MAG: hypothetical protein LBP26_01765 [Clostridiales bacterium]|jgi:hypothetical protein|nr:hypothetical protein [Clostridiales bacterium]